jgi:hypothetical protein
MPTTKTKPSKYKPHPMLAMEQKAKERVQEQSGKTWARLLHEVEVRTKAARGGKEVRAWLQEEYGLRPMDARWIEYEATHPSGVTTGEPEPLVDALYAGRHAPLRPVHEAVVDAMIALGDDVVVTACQTMVPVYRKHVFAEMRPVDGAVEVQLALGAVAAKGRLEKSDGRMPGDRLTHRVLVRSARDVDREMKGWLEAAYGQGAGKMARSTEFEVPADFAKALRTSKPATATWGTMTPAMQRDMVQWVTSAKQDETRARRLATSIEKLASGKKRVY